MPPPKSPVIPDGIIDELLSGSDAKSLFEPNGLLDHLKKAFAERISNAELDHHLDGTMKVLTAVTATAARR